MWYKINVTRSSFSLTRILSMWMMAITVCSFVNSAAAFVAPKTRTTRAFVTISALPSVSLIIEPVTSAATSLLVGAGTTAAFGESMDETMRPFMFVVGGGVAFFALVPFVLQGFVEAVDGALDTFEIVMKENYPDRWAKKMEPKLQNLDQAERGSKLFEIMDALKKDEPEFMKKVEDEMRSVVKRSNKK